MSSAAYYLVCLAAGLLVAALASALIVRHLRRMALRQAMALELLDALARYTEWVALQGRAVFFHAGVSDSESAVHEIGGLQALWFPELQPQTQAMFDVHRRLVQFLRSQYSLRLQDAEAWFESDPDAGFMALWRDHCRAVQSLERRLTPAARASETASPFTSTA